MLLPGCSNKTTSAVVPATQRPDLPSMRCSSCRFGYGCPYPVSNCVVVSRSARQTLCSGRSTPSKCRAECQHEIQSYRLRGSLGSQLCLSCLFFVIREVSEPSERVCPLSLSLFLTFTHNEAERTWSPKVKSHSTFIISGTDGHYCRKRFMVRRCTILPGRVRHIKPAAILPARGSNWCAFGER